MIFNIRYIISKIQSKISEKPKEKIPWRERSKLGIILFGLGVPVVLITGISIIGLCPAIRKIMKYTSSGKVIKKRLIKKANKKIPIRALEFKASIIKVAVLLIKGMLSIITVK